MADYVSVAVLCRAFRFVTESAGLVGLGAGTIVGQHQKPPGFYRAAVRSDNLPRLLRGRLGIETQHQITPHCTPAPRLTASAIALTIRAQSFRSLAFGWT